MQEEIKLQDKLINDLAGSLPHKVFNQSDGMLSLLFSATDELCSLPDTTNQFYNL